MADVHSLPSTESSSSSTVPPTLPLTSSSSSNISTSSSSIPPSASEIPSSTVRSTVIPVPMHPSTTALTSSSSASTAPSTVSTNKAAVGTVNVQRRTWDKDEYERKAKERLQREQDELLYTNPNSHRYGDSHKSVPSSSSSSSTVVSTSQDTSSLPEYYRTADRTMKGPEKSDRAFLVAREQPLQLDSQVNKRKITTDADAPDQHGGFYCSVCDCTLKDSVTWVDHINGRKHQRALGFSMRVEKSNVNQITAKLVTLKEKNGGVSGNSSSSNSSSSSGGATLSARERLLQQIQASTSLSSSLSTSSTGNKRSRAEYDDDNEKGTNEQPSHPYPPNSPPSSTVPLVIPASVPEEEPEQDDMLAMLGFGGFGGSKKK